MKRIGKRFGFIVFAAGLAVMLISAVSFGSEKTVQFKDGYRVIQDGVSSATEKIKLPAAMSKILYSENNQRYLLIYQDTQKPADIYNSDGTKISEIMLTGEAVEIADDGRMIVETSDGNDTNIRKILDGNGSTTFEIPKELSSTGAKFIDTDKLLAWAKNTENYSIIAVYDNSAEKLYEKVFSDSTVNIEQVAASSCGSEIVILTSREVYDYGFRNRQISVPLTNYTQGTTVSSDILKN